MTSNGPNNNNITGQKRKSRFDTDITDPVAPETKRLNLEVSVAAAKAADLSKDLAAKVKKPLPLLSFSLNPLFFLFLSLHRFNWSLPFLVLVLDLQKRKLNIVLYF